MDDARFVLASAPGCHVAARSDASWLLGAHGISKWRRQLGIGKKARLPELSLEPTSKTLSLINESEVARVYFVSVCHPCIGRAGTLQAGAANVAAEKKEQDVCTTIIVAVQPGEVVDACKVEVGNVRHVNLASDIINLEPEFSASLFGGLNAPSATHLAAIPLSFVQLGFPLPPGRKYLCSQAACGALTHRWHPSTYHAVDLEAAVGTEVLAVADGRVVDIQDRITAGGVHVSGFFEFNCLTVRVRAGLDPAAPLGFRVAVSPRAFALPTVANPKVAGSTHAAADRAHIRSGGRARAAAG